MRCLTLIVVVVVVRLNLHLGFFEFGIKLDYIVNGGTIITTRNGTIEEWHDTARNPSS
jgi:hypothetical protein